MLGTCDTGGLPMLNVPFPLFRRLNWMMAALGALLLLVGIGVWWTLRATGGDTARRQEGAVRAMESVTRVNVVLHDTARVVMQRVSAVRGEEAGRLDREHGMLRERMARELALLRAAVPEVGPALMDLERAFAEFLAVGAGLHDRGAGGRVGGATAEADRARFQAKFERLRGYAFALADHLRARLGTEATAADQLSGRRILRVLAVSALFLLAGWGLALLWIWLDVGGPMEELVAATRRMLAGDLNVVIPGGERGDEAGFLSNAMGTFRQGLIRKRELEEAESAWAEREVLAQAECRQARQASAQAAEAQAAAEARRDQLQAEVDRLTTLAETATGQRQELERERARLAERLMSREAELGAVAGERAGLSAELTRLQDQVQAVGAEAARWRSEAERGASERAVLATELARVRDALDEALAASLAAAVPAPRAEDSPASVGPTLPVEIPDKQGPGVLPAPVESSNAVVDPPMADPVIEPDSEDTERSHQGVAAVEEEVPGGVPAAAPALYFLDEEPKVEEVVEVATVPGMGEAEASRSEVRGPFNPPAPGTPEPTEPAGLEGAPPTTAAADPESPPEVEWVPAGLPRDGALSVTAPAPGEGGAGVEGAGVAESRVDSEGTAVPLEPGVEGKEDGVPVRKKAAKRKKGPRDTQMDLLAAPAPATSDESLRAMVASGRVPGVDMEDAQQRLGLPRSEVEDLLRRFAAEQVDLVRSLRSAMEEGDREEARRLAQALAAAAGHLSVYELRRHAKTIELAVKFGQTSLDGMMAEMEAEAARVFAGIGMI